MTSMLIGMGVAQSGQVVGKIGETFGVSNLALDTEGVGDSSQVVVSGYVLPGLQVKYGVGIFDSLATLTLRYRLMPKLYGSGVWRRPGSICSISLSFSNANICLRQFTTQTRQQPLDDQRSVAGRS
jgi:translocation and assembly module TamB